MNDLARRAAAPQRLLLAAVLSGMLVNVSAASAAGIENADKVAAVVERIIGDSTKIQLQPERPSGRDGDEANQPLRVFKQLYAGDRIDVRDPNGAVVILLVSTGERRTLTYGEPPFNVPKPEPSPTLWGNLGQEVVTVSMKFISSLWSEKQATAENTIAAVSRGGETGGELRAPVFQFGAQRVVAGERTFTLAWEGGEPPYTVDIKREGNAQPLARVDGLSSPEVPPTDVRLQPGRHSIIIRDRDNAHTVRLAFDAVEASREPSPGNPSPFFGLPREAGTTLSAVWLAAQEGGVWSLESVQRVEGLARSGYQPAILLRDRLLFDGKAITLQPITQ